VKIIIWFLLLMSVEMGRYLVLLLLSNAAYCLLSVLGRVQENPDAVLNYVINQGL